MNDTDMTTLTERVKALSRPLDPQPTGAVPRLPPLRNMRAVVFDIYGTLLISASGDIGLAGDRNEAGAFAAALGAAGLESVRSDAGPNLLKQVIQQHHDNRRAQGVEYPEVDILSVWGQVLKHLNLNVDSMALQRLAVEYECRVNPVWPMPGLVDVLRRLTEAGLKLGIVSNAQFYTPLMFEGLLCEVPERLGFTSGYCVWSYQLLEAKPSIRLYEKCLGALHDSEGIAADEVLYVGNDQLKDIWPAATASCRTALFAGDARSLRLREDDARCRHVSPDAVVTALPQLLELLDL